MAITQKENIKSDNDDANDDTDDESIPNIAMAVQHAEDPPSFMRVLHFEAMHAPEFLEYAKIYIWLVVMFQMVNCMLECNFTIGRL